MSGLRTTGVQTCTLGTSNSKTLYARSAPSTHGITIAEITVSANSFDATQKVPGYTLSLFSGNSGGTGTNGTIAKDPNFSDDVSAGSTKVGTLVGNYSVEPTLTGETVVHNAYIEPRGVGAIIRIPGGVRIPPGYTLALKCSNNGGTDSSAAIVSKEDI